MKTRDLLSFDQQVAEGVGLVAGMDEAGRGPLAGPVSAACVIMPLDCPIEGVNDSKKLSESRREKLYPLIMERALAVGTAMVEASEIDRINILQATRLAMTRAYHSMGEKPDLLLTDAMDGLALGVETRSMIKGDATSYNIAAASIVAKVTRDRLMIQMEEQYPGYGFAKHKGYGTAEHIAAVRALGPCAEHRSSFLGGILGNTNRDKGRHGENLAEKYLLACGLKVLERNYRSGRDELDIIALDGGTVAFVEVKYRESSRFGTPGEAVDSAKRRNITQAAAAWMQARNGTDCRFDVIEVVKQGGSYDINHIKDAFPAERGELFL
jgi:ribonuclease HII